MKVYDRIVFVGKSGNTREPMAMGILGNFALKHPVEICARGLVVLFEEPINQKAEAVLISNGVTLEDFTSKQFSQEDLSENTLVLTMEKSHRERILEEYEEADPENIHVLTDFVGDELEILDPYGGTLTSYGLCYETLYQTIKKLVHLLNEGE